MNVQKNYQFLKNSICNLSRHLNKDLFNKSYNISKLNHFQYRLINTYVLNNSKLKSIPYIKYNSGNFSSNSNSNKSKSIPILKDHIYSDNGQTIEELIKILKQPHPDNNIPDNILAKLGRNLHQKEHHPLNIIKTKIEKYCNEFALKKGQTLFKTMDNICPLVDTINCFDLLRVAPDNVCRSKSDTYYNTDKTLLRTHTSAHQCTFISNNIPSFLCTGDVYRRDEIDSSHYPVFHQMEGVRIFQENEIPNGYDKEQIEKLIEDDLKEILTGLAKHLFGNVEVRWRDDFFPFTEPSFELDIYFNGDWMEVLGCGVIHNEVMTNSGKPTSSGWAFGLGLERLAMVLFSIPDIRLFWTDDVRFTSQFNSNSKIKSFIPYSKYPMCYKDVSFWIPSEGFHQNDVYEIIRNVAGDLVEKVELFDEFNNKKISRTSHAYRIVYRDMNRSLTNEEVDAIQMKVRDELVSKLHVELR